MVGARSLFNALDRRLRDESGLSRDDFDVLAAIQRFPNVKMGALADELSFSPSRLSNVIQRMEDQGWVHRVASTDDKRAKTLTLSSSGEEALAEAWRPYADAIRELFLEHLTEQDRQALGDMFTRIRKATRP